MKQLVAPALVLILGLGLNLHAQAPAAPATVTDPATSSAAQAADAAAADEAKDDEGWFIGPGHHGGPRMEARLHGPGRPVELLVPISLFICIVVLVLGVRYLRERTMQSQIELLKMMAEKGQPIPESAFQQLAHCGRGGRGGPWGDPEFMRYRRARRGYGLTFAGLGLGVYALVSGHHGPGIWIASIVLLALGLSAWLAHRDGGSGRLPPQA